MNKVSFISPSVEKETIESLSQKLLEVNRQLTEANRELKRVQSEKEEMLSNISHDLRAPITAIRSALDYLNSGQEISLEDYIASLQLIDRRTQTLENLIQDMYYLFCVEDTSRELELVTLEAAPFLEEYFYDMISDKRYHPTSRMHRQAAADQSHRQWPRHSGRCPSPYFPKDLHCVTFTHPGIRYRKWFGAFYRQSYRRASGRKHLLHQRAGRRLLLPDSAALYLTFQNLVQDMSYFRCAVPFCRTCYIKGRNRCSHGNTF